MDSNSSNSENNVWPKHEYDSDVDEELKICSKPHWNSENTMKLIKTLERDCKELWDTSHPLVKVRSARQAKLEFLANLFTTSPEEINRKIHNLRTQFNNELRKIKRRQCGPEGSGWEYFDSLMFMQRAPLESLGITGPVNLELAEFQANEEQIATVQSDITSNSNSKTHPGTAPYHDIPGNDTVGRF
ncbi:unnamed protein product [Leptosia nina]|uniref:MADF domain-containing protein n=1 Tax=Leptosia nina TaxID=320188 RepID=A0AAV1JTP9_9NEOP